MFTRSSFAVATSLFILGLVSAHTFAQPSCSGTALIDQTLPAGGRWQLCWQEDTDQGVVLSDVYYQPPGESSRRVLESASIAQLHIDFDDGRASRHIVTEDGLGGSNLLSLDSSDCDGSLIGDTSRDVLCAEVVSRRPSYKYYGDVEQGYALEIYSVSNVDDHSWRVQWTLFDDGTVVPAIVLAGELVEAVDAVHGWEVGDSSRVFVSTLQTALWRLDFAIGNSASDDKVQEFEVHPSGGGYKKSLQVRTLGFEEARPFDAALKRSWRISRLVDVQQCGTRRLLPCRATRNRTLCQRVEWSTVGERQRFRDPGSRLRTVREPERHFQRVCRWSLRFRQWRGGQRCRSRLVARVVDPSSAKRRRPERSLGRTTRLRFAAARLDRNQHSCLGAGDRRCAVNLRSSYSDRLTSRLLFCLLLGMQVLLWSPSAQAQNCSGDALIDVTLPEGGRWQMCWEHRNREGVILRDVVLHASGRKFGAPLSPGWRGPDSRSL